MEAVGLGPMGLGLHLDLDLGHTPKKVLGHSHWFLKRLASGFPVA